MRKAYIFTYSTFYGDLDGLFIAEEEEVEKLIGRDLYFGEVLGKHSEVYVEVSADNIGVFSDDTSLIDAMVAAAGGDHICGYNPLDYARDEDEEDDFDELEEY